MQSFLFAQTQAPAQSTAEDRSTAFRSVQGGNQLQSGEMLLVEAYAAIWILLFGMLFLFWKRQASMGARIENLEAAIIEARKNQGQGGSAKQAQLPPKKEEE